MKYITIPKNSELTIDLAAITTLAPSRAIRRAMAFPIPLLPPVINTVLFLKLSIHFD